MPFIKLDAGVLMSTIWTDEPAWKLFQAAMLRAEPTEFHSALEALDVRTMESEHWWIPPGWYGFARVSGPWLVAQYRAADPEECWRALVRLCSPEPESRSQDFSGRRLARVDGGYIVFNFMKYRDFDHGAADRMRKLRARKKGSVTPNSDAVRPNVTHSREQRAEAESRAFVVDSSTLVDPRERIPSADALAKRVVVAEVIKSENWTAEAGDIWKARFGGTSKYGLIGRELKPLVDEHGWGAVKAVWIKYLATLDDSRYASPHHFATVLFGKLAGIRKDPPPKDDVSEHNSKLVDDATWDREMRKLSGDIVRPMPAAVQAKRG